MNNDVETCDRRLGVAVVGLGNAGRQHLAALDSVASARAIAVVDDDPAAETRSPLPVHTLDTVLANDDVDVIAVCTPPGLRYGIVRAAFAAGKHVLLEKPPARDAAELASLLADSSAAGLMAAVMFQHRFALPEFLRTVAPEQFAGASATLVVSRPRDDDHYRAPGWRSQPSLAVGGITAHLGVHYLDLACQLLGSPTSVRVISRTDAAVGIDVRLTAHVSFAGGAELTVLVTSTAATRMERLTVLAADGWVELQSGRTTGELAGKPVAYAARPAVELRAEVYRELAGAVLGASPLELASVARCHGVMAILDGMFAGAGER